MCEKLVKNNFDINDIHRIREKNYERQKNMTITDAIADNEKRAMEIKKQLREKGFKLI